MSKGTLNKVMLIGNLGKDPEIRYTQDGKAIANFTMATARVWGKGENRKEETEWHRIVAFDKLAEIVGEYLKSGHKCYIEGRLQTRKWQNKEGKDQYTTEVVADTMEMLGGKSASKPEPAQAAPQQEEPPYNDDIPFWLGD